MIEVKAKLGFFVFLAIGAFAILEVDGQYFVHSAVYPAFEVSSAEKDYVLQVLSNVAVAVVSHPR